ncbi:MAG TPA: crosslink repair DNA glycosylase YcaQ family protein [Bryobacteraceae bacterium]|jgi:hypothetical protein|nr:crosslink repair DNA glycosylase YcaQ family protein [Bryobacteraceae bacterium]
MGVTLEALKSHALASSLFKPTTLRRAIERLGFVQADPIRSPARAQDLILRHRVKDYAAGDLEAQYAKLALEEDYLYAYGFMPEATWRLLHPRVSTGLSSSEQQVLELVSAQKHLHPRELEEHLGRAREQNAWGGYSKATTRILQALHYRGMIRVSSRENGVRVYQTTKIQHHQIEPEERLRKLVLLIAAILAPLPERSLRATLRLLAHAAPNPTFALRRSSSRTNLEGPTSAVKALIASGDLTSAEVDGHRYVWPAGNLIRKSPPEMVRFLAPFDPLVWDRRRFEHFWGWAYRFEAYTPPLKRKLGYYAMPLLWRDEVVGWVNISRNRAKLNVKAGYVGTAPKGDLFRNAFDAEVQRFASFLQPKR